MNQRQLEVQKLSVQDEKRIIRQLQQVYKKASEDCQAKIEALAARQDLQNIQTIIYQQQYQKALKKQLDSIFDELQASSFQSISDYLEKSYENGFFGTLYDLQGQGIPLIIPIDQRQVVQALELDTKLSEPFYDRLGEDVTFLKKKVKAEVSRGIANGSTWWDVAQKIATGMNSPLKTALYNSMRIARTEGHRIQNQAQWDTINKAKAKGADIVKQWDSTLDQRTRATHRRLDGQIRELDEPFEVDGHKAMYPGGFGIPKEDIHCRCVMLQRAKWALDEEELQTLKDRAAYFELDKAKDFEDYKNKYLKAVQEIKEQGVQLGELETAYGKKHSKAISQQMQDAPEEIRKVWNDCVGDFHCLDPKYRGDKAFYSPGFDGVKLSISKAAKGSDYQTPYQVVFHKYGHHADYVLNRKYGNGDRKKAFSETYKDGIFGKTLKKEAKNAVEDFARKQKIFKGSDTSDIEDEVDRLIKRRLIDPSERADVIAYKIKKAQEAAETIDWDAAETEFCEHIKKELTLMQRSDISDMFEPIMSKKHAYPFGVGHGTSYWNSRDNGKEGFAEMYSAMVDNPESLEQIKRFFPESFKIFQEMLGVVK